MQFPRIRRSYAGAGVVLVPGVATTLLVGSALEPNFGEHDKAYYADPQTVAFVRPGLDAKIRSAEVTADRTVKTRFQVSDPRGLPLDLDGVLTPAPIRTLLVVGYIPSNSTGSAARSGHQ